MDSVHDGDRRRRGRCGDADGVSAEAAGPGMGAE